MNCAIELHDSECLAIEKDSDGNGVVVLDAYVHRTDGEPGVSPGEGGWQRVHLVIESMTISGAFGPLPVDLDDGTLEADGVRLRNLLPLPSVHSGEVVLTLEFLYDAGTLSISGKNIKVEQAGEFCFVEHVDPH
jgi:hypothetical protein